MGEEEEEVLKPLSAYNLFVQEHRKMVLADDPSHSPQKVMQIVGCMWRSLTTEQKTCLEDQYRVQKKKYDDYCVSYKLKHGTDPPSKKSRKAVLKMKAKRKKEAEKNKATEHIPIFNEQFFEQNNEMETAFRNCVEKLMILEKKYNAEKMRSNNLRAITSAARRNGQPASFVSRYRKLLESTLLDKFQRLKLPDATKISDGILEYLRKSEDLADSKDPSCSHFSTQFHRLLTSVRSMGLEELESLESEDND